MPVKSPSSLLETASRPSSMSCWVVLRYLVSLFVRPGCSVARTLAAPSFVKHVSGERIVTKWPRLAIKVLLADNKSVSKVGYSEDEASWAEGPISRRTFHCGAGWCRIARVAWDHIGFIASLLLGRLPRPSLPRPSYL